MNGGSIWAAAALAFGVPVMSLAVGAELPPETAARTQRCTAALRCPSVIVAVTLDPESKTCSVTVNVDRIYIKGPGPVTLRWVIPYAAPLTLRPFKFETHGVRFVNLQTDFDDEADETDRVDQRPQASYRWRRFKRPIGPDRIHSYEVHVMRRTGPQIDDFVYCGKLDPVIINQN